MAQTGIWKTCMSIIYISSCFNLPWIYQDISNIGYFTSLVNECMYNNILWGVFQMKEKWQGCQIGSHSRGIRLLQNRGSLTLTGFPMPVSQRIISHFSQK